MLQRYLLVWLILLSAVAYYWPQWGPAGFDPFVLTKPYLLWLFAVTMGALGCLLPRDEIEQVYRRWPTVLGGTTVQYLAMPALAYAVGHLMKLDGVAMTGVVLVGCVPGAMASNVLTLAARGNVSYSVSLTTSATLLSPVVVPFALWLTLGTRHSLDTFGLFQTLLLTVVLPVVAGHLLCRAFPRFARLMQFVAPAVANLTILWIIAVVVRLNRESLAAVDAQVLAALLLINVLGYAAGYAGSVSMRLPESMRRALTLEIGMQNAGLGTVLALGLFPDKPATAIPPAVYTFGCMLTGTLLAQIWSRFGLERSAEGESR